MTIRTENFDPKIDKKLVCTCGHERCDFRSVDQDTLDMLQCVREMVCRPLTITSGGRCPNHPEEAKKAKLGDHAKCKAVDVKVNNGIERMQIVKAGIAIGFNAIGVANSFVHLGVRKGEKPVMWIY